MTSNMTKTKKTRKKRSPRYEQRIVLFIDFLGFKEIVERTRDDRPFLAHLVKAMDRVGQIGRDNKEFSKSQRITQFSDCIVVSYNVNECSAVFWLLNEVAFCVIDLVERGFLLRGALTVGDLLHTRTHIVGPAMVAAYELESKVAKFPRILIDLGVLAVARRARSELHSPDEEAEYVKGFMTKDMDARYYFDYVSWTSVVEVTGGNDELYPDYLEKVGALQHDNPGVAEKYLWLHDQYVKAIDLIATLPADNPYRLSNPENVTLIEGLPKHDALAKKARKLVTARPSHPPT